MTSFLIGLVIGAVGGVALVLGGLLGLAGAAEADLDPDPMR